MDEPSAGEGHGRLLSYENTPGWSTKLQVSFYDITAHAFSYPFVHKPRDTGQIQRKAKKRHI
jgi:hypothetical protein